ncbi:hypothetical protein I302_103685 [Kwoniella bestiolae CBS 10118]|uniref:Uncharacterized protein n=1 Tax=Kwoniella bestiolae CBS 10118 TaxID=1296100 RepID=A0A1B9G926_9TREE|nr:hypothetical protein I302_02390 [Kwoniella bestiolae CBS 10118]OCF27548.1 hypothetical protein I302_02390 [Kwoniella bestiolae CBS 10118]
MPELLEDTYYGSNRDGSVWHRTETRRATDGRLVANSCSGVQITGQGNVTNFGIISSGQGHKKEIGSTSTGSAASNSASTIRGRFLTDEEYLTPSSSEERRVVKYQAPSSTRRQVEHIPPQNRSDHSAGSSESRENLIEHSTTTDTAKGANSRGPGLS